ncbi:MAG: hypothetical protein JNL64_14865 [Blastocatellia bacterium]|jgi:hypothetical protein|nr:hypothetical protein [Blastocatellia bacterium]
MENAEKLRNLRNLLLKQHKLLIDRERESYEILHGQLTAGAFLNQLIENEDFAWLRQFSMLIVEVDELFAQRDGYEADMVDALIFKVAELVDPNVGDDAFNAKYDFSMSILPEAAEINEQLKAHLAK